MTDQHYAYLRLYMFIRAFFYDYIINGVSTGEKE